MKINNRNKTLKELRWCRITYLDKHLIQPIMHFNHFFGIKPPKKYRF